MDKGTLLHTKDGRRFGNAIILDAVPHPESGTAFAIETDFGNRATLTAAQIKSLFFIGGRTDIDRRNRDRRILLDGGTPPLEDGDFHVAETPT